MLTMPLNDDEDIKCPETVPEEQKGLTEAERSWSAQKPQRPVTGTASIYGCLL